MRDTIDAQSSARMDITFSKEAEEAIRLIQDTNEHVFVTGKAGTGKSTLLEHIRLYSKKKMIVLAPTGVAAINVNGDTIHSFFSLKPGFEKDEARNKRIDDKRAKRYRSIKTILIDEISMVRADLLDAVDIFLRKARKSSQPFGGVQMVFFGDLFQLPPVVTRDDKEAFFAEYSSPYFFSAEVFKGQQDLFSVPFELKYIELRNVYRQRDNAFIEILNAVRENRIQQKHIAQLNTRLDHEYYPEEEPAVFLMTTNADARRHNEAELLKLQTDEVTFYAKTTGEVNPRNLPNDEEVTVKVGSQIMFIYNDPERRWVNGTIGVITDIQTVYNEERGEEEHVLIVQKNDGLSVTVRPYTWEISKYVFKDGAFVREIMGSFRQIPLKLAWAMTIHKSQGKTFDHVVIDLGRGSFAHGQTYVALSRCTSLEGIVLKKPISRSSIIMDQRVKAFKGKGLAF